MATMQEVLLDLGIPSNQVTSYYDSLTCGMCRKIFQTLTCWPALNCILLSTMHRNLQKVDETMPIM